jgi:hypothetical protein
MWRLLDSLFFRIYGSVSDERLEKERRGSEREVDVDRCR